jgi:branched-chain amino acid transport system substrate-binding protein
MVASIMRSLCAVIVLGALGASALRAAPTADPYEIHVIVPLTGGGTFIGKSAEDSLTILEGVTNKQGGIRGRPVHFVFHDDQTNPQTSLQMATQIIATNPTVFLGSTLVANCLAVSPLVIKGPVNYCLTPSIHPAPGSYIFASAVSTKDFMHAFVRFFRERGWSRVAIISSTDSGGADGDAEFAAAMDLPENKNAGLQLVAREHFNPTDFSVSGQMARIKAATPQVVVCYTPGTPFGTLLRGVRDVGIDVPIATGSANMSYAQMKQYATLLPKELYFPGPPFIVHQAANAKARAVQTTFYDAFRAAGLQPDYLHGLAYDPGSIVITALRTLGTDATPDQIRDYIAHLHDWTGVEGEYDFRDGSQRGLTEDNVLIARWDANKSTWVAASGPGGAPL